MVHGCINSNSGGGSYHVPVQQYGWLAGQQTAIGTSSPWLMYAIIPTVALIEVLTEIYTWYGLYHVDLTTGVKPSPTRYEVSPSLKFMSAEKLSPCGHRTGSKNSREIIDGLWVNNILVTMGKTTGNTGTSGQKRVHSVPLLPKSGSVIF